MKLYSFPCGCKVPIDGDRPPIHGMPSLIYDVQSMPLTCPAVWELISSGRTKGIFQLESGLGKQWAKRLKPETIEHLSALVALLRPGCLKAKDERGVSMTELYCRRKNGEEEVNIDIPAIEHILAPTYDVMAYQEQMMEIAKVVAAFDLVWVDKLRKAAGKKDQQMMADVGKVFVEDATALGIITKEEAERLFENIRKSGRYSFNKSHSVAYAIDSYWTAHYKAHFPLYFFTAYLTGAKDKQKPLKEIKELVNDAKDFNIEVLPPRFCELRKHFGTPDGVKIYFGLADVSKIGERKVDILRGAAKQVEDQLEKTLTEWSWFDFMVFYSPTIDSTAVTQMIRAGAMRDTSLPRQKLMVEYKSYLRLSKGEREALTELHLPVYKKKRVNEGRKAKRDEEGNVIYEMVYDEDGEPILIDEARPVNNLIDAMEALLKRPGIVKGKRIGKVQSQIDLLKNPPYKCEDTPFTIAKMEEETLGVPITFCRVDTADKHRVNTTCREYQRGKDEGEMVLCVEINEINEILCRSGDNRGKNMAKMVVSDETGSLDGVTIFTKAYEKYGHLLQRPNTLVAIGVKRDYKDKTTPIIEKVWEV